MFEKMDIGWFTSIPGILTCIGVLLILISIIIFISSLKGGKKNKKESENVSDTPVVESQVATATPVTETVETKVATVTPVTPVAETQVATVTPVTETIETEASPEVQQPQIAPEITPIEQTTKSVDDQLQTIEIQPIEIAPEITPIAAVPPVNPNIEPEVTNLPFNGETVPPTEISSQNTENNTKVETDVTPSLSSIPKSNIESL